MKIDMSHSFNHYFKEMNHLYIFPNSSVTLAKIVSERYVLNIKRIHSVFAYIVAVAAHSTKIKPRMNSADLLSSECIGRIFNTSENSFQPSDCCLTKTCSAERISKKIHNKEVHSVELCGVSLYLLREQLSGCSSLKNDHVGAVNKDTNSQSMGNNEAALPPVTNRISRSGFWTINSDTWQINSESRRELEMPTAKSTSASTSIPFMSLRRQIKTVPVSRNISELFENVTQSQTQLSTSTRVSRLHFLEVPVGDPMRIGDLRLDEEYLLFEAFSSLIGYLHPDHFPTDLVRRLQRGSASLHFTLLEILRMEVFVIMWLFLWAVLAICLPLAVMSYYCCPKNDLERLEEDLSESSSMEFRHQCTVSALASMLHVCLILILCSTLLMLAANEKLSRSVGNAPKAAAAIFQDVETFIKNCHMQISFVVTTSTDITIEAIRKDLAETDEVLGKPYQKELAFETGIDIALNALDDLKSATAKVTSLVTELLNECTSAGIISASLQEQLSEISRQLAIAREQCPQKDRTVCYTLQVAGFDVIFSTGNLTEDTRIKQLDRIGKDKNFNISIEYARRTFEGVPGRVSLDTAPYITGIRNVLSKRRTEVYKSVHELDELSKAVSQSIKSSQRLSAPLLETVSGWDLWRWVGILVLSLVISVVWGLLLCGAPCGCGLTSRTVPLLIAGVGLSCIMCLPLWLLGSVSFLAGGHGHSLICDPLHGQPRYETLAALFDKDGVFYDGKGLLNDFIWGNNDTLMTADVLRDCQMNDPAYITFHLCNTLNIHTVTNYRTWGDLKALLKNFTVGDSNLEVLSPSLQLNLQALSTISAVNFTMYRSKISESLTRRDLNSFADQLNVVARQLADLDSSQRIDNLAFMTRKVVQNEMKRLGEIRDRILYRITALEVQLLPLNKQTNQSLSHLKTIQYYLDNQGWLIADRNSRRFTSRIENYLEDLYDHVYLQVAGEIGKCRPLWEVFRSARFYLCKLVVHPMSGLSVASYALILLFLLTSPVVIKLIQVCYNHHEELLTTGTHRRARDGLVINEEGTWATPSSDIPDFDIQNHEGSLEHEAQDQAAWLTPGSSQSSEPLFPPPPRPISELSSRITSPRVPQIPSLAKPRKKSPNGFAAIAARILSPRGSQAASPPKPTSSRRERHEALRLVEPIRWKTGAFSPRSWI